MNTIDDSDLAAIHGGDSFWTDLGQFIGGAYSSVVNGAPSLYPMAPGGSTLAYGLIAAIVIER